MANRLFFPVSRAYELYFRILLIILLALTGCRKGSPKQDIRHDEIKELNARVLEKAIGEPDSALMMIMQRPTKRRPI